MIRNALCRFSRAISKTKSPSKMPKSSKPSAPGLVNVAPSPDIMVSEAFLKAFPEALVLEDVDDDLTQEMIEAANKIGNSPEYLAYQKEVDETLHAIRESYYDGDKRITADSVKKCSDECDEAVHNIKMKHFERISKMEKIPDWVIPLPKIQDPLILPGAKPKEKKKTEQDTKQLTEKWEQLMASVKELQGEEADNVRTSIGEIRDSINERSTMGEDMHEEAEKKGRKTKK